MLAILGLCLLILLCAFERPKTRLGAASGITLILASVWAIIEGMGQAVHYTDWSFRVACLTVWILFVGQIYNLWPAFMTRPFDGTWLQYNSEDKPS